MVFGASHGFKMVLFTELSDNLSRRYMRSTECPSSYYFYALNASWILCVIVCIFILTWPITLLFCVSICV